MRYLVPIFIALASIQACAIEVASCSNPTGFAYYAEAGLVSAKDSGWSNEKITGGITKLSKDEKGEYDILFVDTRKQIISAREEGAHVLPLNRAQSAVSMLVVYPGKTAEVYTFLQNNSGRLEYLHTLSRAGDGVSITKSSVMQGPCDYINFSAL